MSLSSSELYNLLLKNASTAEGLPIADDDTQNLLSKCLDNLRTLHSRIVELSIFSPNETADDISTTNLVYLTLPYVFAGVQNLIRTTEHGNRSRSIAQIIQYLQLFMSQLETYCIIPENEQMLYKQKADNLTDPAKKRELKINQYKTEKDLNNRIQGLRKRLGKDTVLQTRVSDYDLIASLLSVSSTLSEGDEEELDPESDEILRDTTLIFLRLFYARAASQLYNSKLEFELLRNIPPDQKLRDGGSEDPRDRKREQENNAWTLDLPHIRALDGRGPLLDESGRPLRPFTILPSDAGKRAELQAKVFGPGYNLPTMTIEEYLETERQQGNIITGGGPASQNVPTTSEQLAIDSEMDGTSESELKAEEKRQKDEKWARYTDEHPRGAGNRMNRG